MKTYYLFTILLLTFLSTNGLSQTEKGTWLLGGSASFISSDGNSATQINPNLGYFFTNNFALGLNAAYLRIENSDLLQFGPNFRVYFGNSNRGKLFLQGGSNIVTDSDFSDVGIGYLGRFGYAAFLNKSIALEISLAYEKFEDNDAVFGTNFGFQIHFGNDNEEEIK